jgi:hypothetical protein
MASTNDYKKLSKFEKLEEIQNLNFAKCERHFVAIYLKALWLNDTKIITEYESFGDRPNQFLMNKTTYDRQLLFGYSEKVFDKYGWFVTPKFNNYEELIFTTKNEKIGSNKVSIGEGLNGKWSFSISYSTGAAGGSSRCDIWGEIVENKETAIIKGLTQLITTHNRQREMLYKKDSCGNYKEDYSRAIVKLVKDKLDEVKGIKGIQLELF